MPRRYDRVVDWYVAHTPADRRTTLNPGASRPAPDAMVYWEPHHTGKAYAFPAHAVAYHRIGPHLTAIRTDVTLAARADRTAETLVPPTVTSLQVTKQAIEPDASPRTVTVTDQNRIYAVIEAFNRVRGQFAATVPNLCGSPQGIVYIYAVTFHWPGHTLAVDPGQELCEIGRKLTLDGSVLPQTLQEGHHLDRTLNAAFDGN